MAIFNEMKALKADSSMIMINDNNIQILNTIYKAIYK